MRNTPFPNLQDMEQETVIHPRAVTHDSKRTEEFYNLLYAEYTSLKQQLGKSKNSISLDSFINKVKEKEQSIQQRHKCKRVTVEVYVNNGRVGIRAKPEATA